ncbi:MAG: VWA domain-containing protein [Chitinophagaceae bacterium]|nr:VWA domain-containing protein [Chitinophagaceae bacterium]
MPHFQTISYFILLLALPVFAVLYLLLINWKKRTGQKIGDEKLVKEMTANHSARKTAIKFVLVCAAFSFCIIALANLRSSKGVEKVKRNGIDVMIALDVSKSMLARDIQPNRLERAKQLLGKLIDRLSNDRVGIVIFAGRAYLQMPLTGDHSAAKMYLASASTDAVPTQGTVLSDALQMCRSAFSTREKKYKSVILVSDGEDHDEGALKIAGQMADEGIVIHTVGMGSPDGSEIYEPGTSEPKKDEQGNVVITRLNEKELMQIAEKANGIYQLYSYTEEVAGKLESSLGSMDQRVVTEDSLVNYRYYFQLFLLLALICLVLEAILSERQVLNKVRSVLTPRLMSFFILAAGFLPFTTLAQTNKSLIKKGNEAYEKKEYDKAISNYKEVTGKDPANPTALYNLGNALYRNQQNDDAVNAFDQAAVSSSNKEDRSRAFYNKGVVLQNNKKLPECIDAYKQALKLNPADDDARQNLQKALQQQKQQQQKEKQDKQQQKPKKEDQKQEPKKPKEEEKNDQPNKPQPSKLSQQDAAEKLKALLEQEKNLQDKLRKINAGSPSRPDKDW